MSILWLVFLFSLLIAAQCQAQPPRATRIDCGATVNSVIDDHEWHPDDPYVFAGTPKNLTEQYYPPTLSTVRSFSLRSNTPEKFCYVVPVFRTGKYLVRTTYFYGGINGRNFPPVFDQIVDGTFWSIVNTTDDYTKSVASYYEGVFVAGGKYMSLCVAANNYTDSDPFISALELILLGDSLYNSTDFSKYGLSLVARHSFGYAGPMIRYPDDQFDRFWEPLGGNSPTVTGIRNLSVSGFWNRPPSKVFETVLTSGVSEPLELPWPPSSLPNSSYYIALYFADHNSSSDSSRVLNISINSVTYYQDLSVSPAGVAVFASRWPLFGATKITLTPASGSNLIPLINAGEVYNVLSLGGRTHTRDVIALEEMKNSLRNIPLDWYGDPCLPSGHSWSGIRCFGGNRTRVISINMSSMNLSGHISSSVANLTALTEIWLGNNSLSGPIPDLSQLRRLEKLYLENNQLSGEIPSSLGDMDNLREVFLQNNNLTGQVPSNLMGRPGLDLRISPGNHFSSPPPS